MLKLLLFYKRVHTVRLAAGNRDFCSNATLQVLECTLLAEDEHWPAGSGRRGKERRRRLERVEGGQQAGGRDGGREGGREVSPCV